MPARASIVINDGAASPVAHTFVPKGGDATLTRYTESSGTTAAGWRQISHEVSPPAGGRSTYKAEIGGYFPTEVIVDGVPVVTSSDSIKCTLNFPPNSTLAERKDALAFLTNWLANATVKDSITNMEPFY